MLICKRLFPPYFHTSKFTNTNPLRIVELVKNIFNRRINSPYNNNAWPPCFLKWAEHCFLINLDLYRTNILSVSKHDSLFSYYSQVPWWRIVIIHRVPKPLLFLNTLSPSGSVSLSLGHIKFHLSKSNNQILNLGC